MTTKQTKPKLGSARGELETIPGPRNSLEVGKFREVPLGSDGRPSHPADPPVEIVRTSDGRLHDRKVVYWAHIPTLELPPRTSPLLAHALRKEWWAAWFYGKAATNRVDARHMSIERIASFAELAGGTEAVGDERIAWAIVNLENLVVFPMVCELAGLNSEAQALRGLPPLSAGSLPVARRIFRRVQRAAEKIAPYVPREKLGRETKIGATLDVAGRCSGLLALRLAIIGADVEGGSEAGEWPAVQNVHRLTEQALRDANHPAWRAAEKVATLQQAEAFREQVDQNVEELLVGLGRLREVGRQRARTPHGRAERVA